jgi:hypothetical protein
VPPGDGHLGTVYLFDEPNRGRWNAQGAGHSLPLSGIASEREVMGREEMTRCDAEWAAFEGGAHRR